MWPDRISVRVPPAARRRPGFGERRTGRVADMKCESCGKNPASVHYTAYENNEPKEMHVCHECAIEKGIVVVPSETDKDGGKFSIQDPIISLFGDLAGQESKMGRVQCPACGILYSTFRETGRLGCAQCYQSFQVQLAPLLRRIHGNLAHAGKSPVGEGEQVERRNRLRKMQEELESAIHRENFERAAEIRDSMKQLREEEQASSGEEEKR